MPNEVKRPNYPRCVDSWVGYAPQFPDRSLYWESLWSAHDRLLPCYVCDEPDDDATRTRHLGFLDLAEAIYRERGGEVKVIISRRDRRRLKESARK